MEVASQVIQVCLKSLERDPDLLKYRKIAIEAIKWGWKELRHRVSRGTDIWKDIGVSKFIRTTLQISDESSALKVKIPFDQLLTSMVQLYDASTMEHTRDLGMLDGARVLGELLGRYGDYGRAISYTKRFIEILRSSYPHHFVFYGFRSMKLLGTLIMSRGAVGYAAPIFQLTYNDMMRYKDFQHARKNAQEVWDLYQQCLEASKSDRVTLRARARALELVCETTDNSTNSNDPLCRFTDIDDDAGIAEERIHDEMDLEHSQSLRLNSSINSPVDYFDPEFQKFVADFWGHEDLSRKPAANPEDEDPISCFTTPCDTPSPTINLHR
ncbi:hypothetical protein AA313_de0206518 [Arthrobotrys entomopaga]|nr:hypothetical protein AA313_de0206518 [Arthrobotrys entomopaga]